MMENLTKLLISQHLVLCFVAAVNALVPTLADHTGHTEWWSSPVTLLVVSFGAVLCGVILIMACASWCPRKNSGFRDFANEDHFQDIRIEPPSTDFIMLPPVIDTVDSGSNKPIEFEPLPDIGMLRRQHVAALSPTNVEVSVSNAAQLRPKVSQIGHDRMEMEDEIECLTGDIAMVHERIKLEKLLSNLRHKITRNQLQYIREIGSGWFGKIFLAEGQDLLPGHKKTRIAIQSMQEASDERSQYLFLQEAAVYREMDHPNILKLFGHCIETTPYLTVLEFCSLGDIKTYLRNRRTEHDTIDKQGLLLNMACDMASGLQAMHQNNFVHRDFAIRNCMVTAELSVKVGDYGLAEQMYKDDYYMDANGDSIPLRWLAPEVVYVHNGSLVLRCVTKDCNLWSFGVALWELVTFGALPYSNLDNEQVIQQVFCDGTVRLSQPEVPVSNLDKLFQLMSLCWLAPAQRPSLRELRIMLLHLRSSRDELDTSTLGDFDRKWNQLMPRQVNGMSSLAPVIVDSDEDSDGDMEFTLDDRPHRTMMTSISSAAGLHYSTLPPGHSATLGTVLSASVVRPASFDSEFSNELNASLLAQAGSLQASLRSFSTSSLSNTPDDFSVGDSFVSLSTVPRFQFTSNETSLAAELDAVTQSSTFEIVSSEENGMIPLQTNGEVCTITGSSSTLSDGHNQRDVDASNIVSAESINSGAAADNDEDWQGFTGSYVSAVIDQAEGSSNILSDAMDSVDCDEHLNVTVMNNSEEFASNRSNVEESFYVLGPVQAEVCSPAKSADLASPTKSTNSSTDWCLVSNSASEHSKEEESDNASRITDHSMLADAPSATNTPGDNQEQCHVDNTSISLQSSDEAVPDS